MAWTLILAYLGLQLFIGFWISRRLRSETDFFVAGRRLGLPLVAGSLVATWFGAETCIGSAGAVYEEGLSGARADPLGYGLCLLLLGVLLARRLWDRSFVTLGDLYRERYGPRIERLAVLVIVPASLLWAAAQVRAFGQVIAATTELEVTTAIAIAAAFVVGYTLLGGLLGDIVTDLLQGGLVVLGLVVLLVAALGELGGPSGFVRAIDPSRLSLVAPGQSFLEQLDRWMVPILGSLVAQESISRVLSARSASVARRSALVAFVAYLGIGSIPIALGLVGQRLVPGLEDGEHYLPLLAREVLPPVLFAVFTGALVSAILSTVDSVLLAAAALLSHNFVVPVLGLESERHKLASARLLVLAAGAASFTLALGADGVYELVEQASAFGAGGVLVTTFAGLFSRRGGPMAAGAALVTGVVSAFVAEHVLELPAPFLTSIAASAVAYAAFGKR